MDDTGDGHIATATADERHRRAQRRSRARKRDRRTLVTLGVVFVLAISGAVGYALQPVGAVGPVGGDDPLRLVTTTTFLDDTVRHIGGEDVETVRLMGPGVDPHLYQAKAGDLREMRRADAVIAVGLYLEGSLQQTLDEVGRTKPVLLAGEAVPADELLSPPADAAPEEEHDPHIWHDPALWTHVVDAVAERLAELDPDHAADYRRRGAAYNDEIRAAADAVQRTIDRIPADRRTLVTSHDAFRYFGDAFGMDVVAIQGISTQQEATTADVARVAELLADENLPAVFLETSVSRQTVDSMIAAARHRGGDVRVGGELYSDSTGPDGSYLGMLRANAATLAEGLT
ncbi:MULTISPECIES: metal ABC transporter solute-binding protein, Zn/Mn family [Prauserella salsuginis group]|uniref:Metal ABC transporter solute-binding protein, Zn/Mn family n=1 Tax=Prauserella salsuginis TaxID=387889 RepID=A0ABW6G260_9PSEU|nr:MULTISPECIES: zinc ABC transporter substrate-binding protein [Prauserella salsuginis group]MCR3719938.1 manganese/zinc/iron transport system substrate-binding protein [Prauserella flava]MCR3736518.1 manganese/zinc/iron transport system substrate-binding protein [Prauserella salsuginis]